MCCKRERQGDGKKRTKLDDDSYSYYAEFKILMNGEWAWRREQGKSAFAMQCLGESCVRRNQRLFSVAGTPPDFFVGVG